MAHDVHPNVHQELRDRLRQLGLRATSPRLAVLVALHDEARPLSHEEVMDQISEGGFDRATVFRILADLAEVGLLRRMDLGDHVWRYELMDACRSVEADHPHFLCEGCGAVACLPPLELRATTGPLPALLAGAALHLRVTGRCGPCVAGG
jgi:Fur family ferric uptake transcriptional regulator